MKRMIFCLLSIVLLLALTSACAQNITAESPIILGGTGDDSLHGFLSLPNGNIILSIASNGGRDGEATYPGLTRKAWLICLAPDGSTVWENEFGDDHTGGYTIFSQLILGDNDSFTGMVSYSISQYSQYRQMMTFSTIDGSLLQSGERIMESMETDNIYRTFTTSQGYRIASETHNFNTNLKPRILRLLDNGGKQLWEFNASENGISHMEQFIPVSQGTLLFGRDNVADSINSNAVAMLINNSGAVVWDYQFNNGSRCGFQSGIIDSEGRFIIMGTVRGDPILNEDGRAVGFEDNTSLLLTCLDVTTGETIFEKTLQMADRRIPSDQIIEYDGRYILCGAGENYNTIEYQALDHDGMLLQHWSDGYPEYGLFGARFFLWNGKLWAKAILDGTTMDVYLTRVAIP